MEKRAAIIEAGKTRMRPILMTALTTILGLSTMSAGVGMGSEMVQPMAVIGTDWRTAVNGTFLTLFVIPCVYDLLNRKNYKKFSQRRRRWRGKKCRRFDFTEGGADLSGCDPADRRGKS